MDPRRQITKGMTVYTHDGDKLGTPGPRPDDASTLDRTDPRHG